MNGDGTRAGQGAAPQAARTRVLIAEDGDDLRRMLAYVIDAEPDLACVGTVATPERLPHSVRETRPDVLVLDLVLEGGSALHLIAGLKREHPQLRIVLHSGYVGSVVLSEARRRGAAAVVAKGASYESLLDAIRGFVPRDGDGAGGLADDAAGDAPRDGSADQAGRAARPGTSR